MLFEDMIAARLPGPSGVKGPGLKQLDDKIGYIGDPKTGSIQPLGDAKLPTTPTVFLPNARLAKAWQAVVTGKPFEP
jgi:hypothetical protein